MILTRHLLAGAAGFLVMSCAAYAAQTLVSQKDKLFDPDEVTQAVGSTLHITNDDPITHNILVTDPGATTDNRGVQKPGDAIDVTFDKPGDYIIHCGIHPKMKLTAHVN